MFYSMLNIGIRKVIDIVCVGFMCVIRWKKRM